MKTILNIASGKIPPLDLDYKDQNYFIVNVDTMFYENTPPDVVEQEYNNWQGYQMRSYNIKSDIFEFLERTVMRFDQVCIYRFLEHVPFDKVLYFIYLLSTVTKSAGNVDVIVPNYEELAKMLLAEDPMEPGFEAHNILLTTELVNEPSCPHASIWTKQRAHHFFQLEGRFLVTSSAKRFEFDGRDIYLRFHARRR
jgi:hypothetical protein